MQIHIIHPKLAKESATLLATTLKANQSNPFETEQRDFHEEIVFNYGCNRSINAPIIINSVKGISNCKDKVKTFNLLKGFPIPAWTTSFKEIPQKWKFVVSRQKADAHANQGMKITTLADTPQKAALYTEYFDHKVELRIVVFKGKVIGRYQKNERDGQWCLDEVQAKGFETIDGLCQKAAHRLSIDFVGFDVLANNEKDFCILEANSAPILNPGLELKLASLIKDYYGT